MILTVIIFPTTDSLMLVTMTYVTYNDVPNRTILGVIQIEILIYCQ